MKYKSIILTIFFTLLVMGLIFVVGYAKTDNSNPQELYQVYLDGKKIGLITSDEELYGLIDAEGQSIKEKYQVSQVFPPNGLEVKKYITYNTNITSTNELYNTIKAAKPFTINAYSITIKPSEGEAKKLYVLNEDVFKTALNNLIYVFISKEEYNNYINESQKAISTTGEILESVYFDENITIKKNYISTEEKIFDNADELTQYLLFGTTEKQKTYVVKPGENIESIAYNNKLNPEEFLISNPDFSSVNQLLSPGQIVNIGLINPIVNLSYEKHVVEDEESIFDTEVVYDSSMTTGTKYTKQEGENGINRVTKKVRMKNGEIQEAFIATSEELKPAVSRIIVKGNRAAGTIYTDESIWKWPTNRPYIITTRFEYRWGEMHLGIDITGKHGSPIYAAGAGTIVFAGWQKLGGKVVWIDHGNGYFSEYAHMSQIYVTEGQIIESGTTIGAMGKTGWSTGTHLHFGFWIGKPFASGSYAVDPLKKYQ